jgi:hypothetical protein
MTDKNTDITRVTARQVAKMLCHALATIDIEDYRNAVDTYMVTLESLTKSQLHALKLAYVFSRRCQPQERDDLYQEIALSVLEHGGDNCKLQYAIARNNWRSFIHNYYRHGNYQGHSLNELIDDGDNNQVERVDIIVGAGEYELISELDTKVIMDSLPRHVRDVVLKRMTGAIMTTYDRLTLMRFRQSPEAQKVLALIRE